MGGRRSGEVSSAELFLIEIRWRGQKRERKKKKTGRKRQTTEADCTRAETHQVPRSGSPAGLIIAAARWGGGAGGEQPIKSELHFHQQAITQSTHTYAHRIEPLQGPLWPTAGILLLSTVKIHRTKRMDNNRGKP